MSQVIIRAKITQKLKLLLFIFSLTNIFSNLFIITSLTLLSFAFYFPLGLLVILGVRHLHNVYFHVMVAGAPVLELWLATVRCCDNFFIWLDN
jgi:hypothetical protein